MMRLISWYFVTKLSNRGIFDLATWAPACAGLRPPLRLWWHQASLGTFRYKCWGTMRRWRGTRSSPADDLGHEHHQKTNKNQRKSMNSLKINENQWKSMKNIENQWKSMRYCWFWLILNDGQGQRTSPAAAKGHPSDTRCPKTCPSTSSVSPETPRSVGDRQSINYWPVIVISSKYH